MDDTLTSYVIFLGIWGLFGLIFFIMGILFLINIKNCTLTTFATVKDIANHRTRSNSGCVSSWHPVFEYTIGELKYIKESRCGRSQSPYAI